MGFPPIATVFTVLRPYEAPIFTPLYHSGGGITTVFRQKTPRQKESTHKQWVQVGMTGFEPRFCAEVEWDALRLPTQNIVVSRRCSLVILLVLGFLRLAASATGGARLRHLVPHFARDSGRRFDPPT